jgi:hypothetical protein
MQMVRNGCGCSITPIVVSTNDHYLFESITYVSSAVGQPKEKIRIEPVESPVPEKTPAPTEAPVEVPEKVEV